MGKNNPSVMRVGFTLIELIVVSGILLASIGFGTARYGDFTNKRRLGDETKKLVAALNQTSKRAVAGDSGATCTDYQGFQMAVTTTGSYAVRRCCEVACSSAQSTVQVTTQLPAGLTFSAPTSNTTYLFNKLTAAITINPAANQTITIRSTVLSRCIPVAISPSGLITQQAEVAC